MTALRNFPHSEKNRTCPLCSTSGPFQPLQNSLGLRYRLCTHCQLIFMERELLPDMALEKERYQTHQNGPQYPGYVKFLNQAIDPTLVHLKHGLRGLDYGCGPTPTISVLLNRQGFSCENYDPFFYPTRPQGLFDFIFATEVLEHFFQPGLEIHQIYDWLMPGGIFTIMTEMWHDLNAFPEWYYAKDFTHVCFYHKNTIQLICEMFGFELMYCDDFRVSILKKTIKSDDMNNQSKDE